MLLTEAVFNDGEDQTYPSNTTPPCGEDIRPYEIIKELSNSKQGAVYKARHVTTNNLFIIKFPGENNSQEFQLHGLVSHHPNVVSIIEYCEKFAILEYCEGGDLFTKIEQGHYDNDDAQIKKVILQIIDAVSYCHSQGIYHRDIKPENIFVTENGSVKLGDFGLASRRRYTSDFGVGTLPFMSPECREPQLGQSSFASAPNDVWAVGIVIIDLLCKRNLWKEASVLDLDFLEFFTDENYLVRFGISHELNHILRKVLWLNPQDRMTLEQLWIEIQLCKRFRRGKPACLGTVDSLEPMDLAFPAWLGTTCIGHVPSCQSPCCPDNSIPCWSGEPVPGWWPNQIPELKVA